MINGKISLDTNIVIRLFKNDPAVTKELGNQSSIYLPATVIAKLLFAARNSAALAYKGCLNFVI